MTQTETQGNIVRSTLLLTGRQRSTQRIPYRNGKAHVPSQCRCTSLWWPLWRFSCRHQHLGVLPPHEGVHVREERRSARRGGHIEAGELAELERIHVRVHEGVHEGVRERVVERRGALHGVH